MTLRGSVCFVASCAVILVSPLLHNRSGAAAANPPASCRGHIFNGDFPSSQSRRGPTDPSSGSIALPRENG